MSATEIFEEFLSLALFLPIYRPLILPLRIFKLQTLTHYNNWNNALKNCSPLRRLIIMTHKKNKRIDHQRCYNRNCNFFTQKLSQITVDIQVDSACIFCMWVKRSRRYRLPSLYAVHSRSRSRLLDHFCVVFLRLPEVVTQHRLVAGFSHRRPGFPSRGSSRGVSGGRTGTATRFSLSSSYYPANIVPQWQWCTDRPLQAAWHN
jgi:hypothetical protein